MARTQSKPDGVATLDIDGILRDYEREHISLGRLAELIGLNRDEATALVQARGLPLRIGPRTVEEALEELRVIERLESR